MSRFSPIRLDPKDAYAYNSRAWLLATCPDAKYRDGKKAVEDATRACQLTELRHMARLYPAATNGHVVLLIDNVPWHRGKLIDNILTEHPCGRRP